MSLAARERSVAGAAWDSAAVETSWGTVPGTTAGAEAGVPTAGTIVDPRLCAIGSTIGVSQRNAGTGTTWSNELTGVAATFGTRAATSESITAGRAEIAGCATFESVAKGGVPPGPGGVDAPAG